MPEGGTEVTRILERIEEGDPHAASEILPLVYDELRKLAAARMAQEAPGQTLQATALVHEVWVRLGSDDQRHWNGRSHFFAAAAEAMRHILIDQARRKASLKRGSGQAAEELHESRIETQAPSEEIVAVHDALEGLEAADAAAAQIVKLRYFVGMTVAEIAEVTGLSPRSVDRQWAYARAWLKRAIQPGR